MIILVSAVNFELHLVSLMIIMIIIPVTVSAVSTTIATTTTAVEHGWFAYKWVKSTHWED